MKDAEVQPDSHIYAQIITAHGRLENLPRALEILLKHGRVVSGLAPLYTAAYSLLMRPVASGKQPNACCAGS